MARRSHYSVNKRQKDIKQKEKAERKVQRRQQRRDQAVALAGTGSGPEGLDSASPDLEAPKENSSEGK